MGQKTKKYQIIYADPPWSYNDPCLERGGALRHYNTMDVKDIMAIPVHLISADNSILFIIC